MHQSSVYIIENFLKKYGIKGRTVLEVGSMDINGSFKKIVEDMGMKYVGIDIEDGPNVDVVLSDPYHWYEIKSHEYDIIISSSTFEHIEFPWCTMVQIRRVMKIGALCCITVPSRGPEHKFPVDCWRIYPDGMKALAKWVNLSVCDIDVYWDKTGFNDNSDKWGDCYCVLRRDK